MRIRTIKPDFYKHEALFELEVSSGLPVRLAFTGLWCAADKKGRFKWRPRQLKVEILPYDDIDFSRVLDALTTRGFIVKYRVGDAWFGCVPSFDRHQIINNRERDSELPDLAAADEASNVEKTNESKPFHASATRESEPGSRGSREGHASKAEGKGREGKGIRKGKEVEGDPASAPPPLPAESPHVLFIDGWAKAFKEAFGFDYIVDGARDGKATKQLLHTGMLWPEILGIAQQAWEHSKADSRAWNCKQAATIHGFKEKLNQIRAELSGGGQHAPGRGAVTNRPPSGFDDGMEEFDPVLHGNGGKS